VDTPVADIGLSKRLATLAEMTDMTVRFERVRAYLGYLESKEKDELSLAAARTGPFQEALMPQVCRQVESEIKVISKKLPGTDLYGRS
jgi:hypothetical protein